MTFNIVPWWAYLAAGAMAGALLAGGVQQARVASVKADLAREQVIRATPQADLATASDKARAAADTARKANAGDMAGACAELSRWTYAGGKQLPGLVRRRATERAVCEGQGA